MKSNIETKMKLMERRQAVHANKIQALMLLGMNYFHIFQTM